MIFRKYITKRRSSVKLMFWPRESQVVFLCRFFESNFMDLHLHWCPYRRSGKVTGGRRRKFYLFSSFTQNHCHLCIQTNTIWTCADVWLFNMDTSIPCAWIRSDYLSLSYETIHHILTGLVIRSIFSKPYNVTPTTTQQHVFDVCVLKCGSKEKTGVDTCYFQICWRNKKAEGR